MDTSEFDSKIEQLESQSRVAYSRIEPQYHAFIDAAPSSMIEWLRKEVNEFVKASPEVIHTMGREGASALKAELEEFYKSLSTRISELLEQNKFWPHRDDFQETPYLKKREVWKVSSKGELISDGGIAHAIHSLSLDLTPILSRYGLPFKPYPHFPSSLRMIGQNYGIALNNFWHAEHELAEVKSQKFKAEADALWDEA